MILIDKINPVTGYCHLVGSSIEELHLFAAKIDVNRCWYSNKRNKFQPHYDLNSKQFETAIINGAKLVLRRELFEFLKNNFKKP